MVTASTRQFRPTFSAKLSRPFAISSVSPRMPQWAKSKPEQSPERRQQQRLGQQLPHDPRRARRPGSAGPPFRAGVRPPAPAAGSRGWRKRWSRISADQRHQEEQRLRVLPPQAVEPARRVLHEQRRQSLSLFVGRCVAVDKLVEQRRRAPPAPARVVTPGFAAGRGSRPSRTSRVGVAHAWIAGVNALRSAGSSACGRYRVVRLSRG